MAIFDYFRQLVKSKKGVKPVEYVREDPRQLDSVPLDVRQAGDTPPLEHDIDLSPQADLEGYARGLSASKASIERWISSGLLMPDEMKVAEKLIKLMNKQ